MMTYLMKELGWDQVIVPGHPMNEEVGRTLIKEVEIARSLHANDPAKEDPSRSYADEKISSSVERVERTD